MSIDITAPARPSTLGHVRLAADSSARLRDRLLAAPDHVSEPDLALTEMHRAFMELPGEPLQAVIDFGRHMDAPGVVLVEGLPVDPDLTSTPVDGGPSRNKRTAISEGNLLGLSRLLGEPTGVTSEKDGQIVHDVIPVASGAKAQTNQGSAVFLNFHNDIVYDPSGIYTLSSPDFLVLVCLRQDHEGRALTHYADARDICALLSSETVAELRKPLFRLNAPGSFCREMGRSQVLGQPAPLINGPEFAPEISVSANGVEPLTEEAGRAVEALQGACREVAHQVALEPGQALLINNRKGLHARSRFEARHDGTDRWLQRSYVRTSLWPIRYRLKENQRRVF